MTQNPFEISDPLLPFFYETVGYISQDKKIKTQLDKCCIFPIETIDPFSDMTLDTDIQKMTVLILADCFDKIILNKKIEPKVGDEIILKGDERFKISKVSVGDRIFNLTVRSI